MVGVIEDRKIKNPWGNVEKWAGVGQTNNLGEGEKGDGKSRAKGSGVRRKSRGRRGRSDKKSRCSVVEYVLLYGEYVKRNSPTMMRYQCQNY